MSVYDGPPVRVGENRAHSLLINKFIDGGVGGAGASFARSVARLGVEVDEACATGGEWAQVRDFVRGLADQKVARRAFRALYGGGTIDKSLSDGTTLGELLVRILGMMEAEYKACGVNAHIEAFASMAHMPLDEFRAILRDDLCEYFLGAARRAVGEWYTAKDDASGYDGDYMDDSDDEVEADAWKRVAWGTGYADGRGGLWDIEHDDTSDEHQMRVKFFAGEVMEHATATFADEVAAMGPEVEALCTTRESWRATRAFVAALPGDKEMLLAFEDVFRGRTPRIAQGGDILNAIRAQVVAHLADAYGGVREYMAAFAHEEGVLVADVEALLKDDIRSHLLGQIQPATRLWTRPL